MAPRRFLASLSVLAVGALTLGFAAPASASAPDYHYHSVTTAGPIAYFSGYTKKTGNELWSTDGTAAGTKLVKDVLPGTASGLQLGATKGENSTAPDFTTIGTKTFFAAHGITTGIQLWSTDGTSAGTQQLTGAGTFHTAAGAEPADLTALGDELYFTVNSSRGRILWKSDGTKAGTKIVPGIVGAKISRDYAGTFPQRLTVVGSKLFFSVISTKDSQRQDIWSTDGTTTKRELALSQTNVGTGYLRYFSEFDGKLLIVTTTKLGKQQRLWTYSGSGLPVALSTIAHVSTVPIEFDGSVFYVSDYRNGAYKPRVFRVTPTASAAGAAPVLLNDDYVAGLALRGGRLWFETHTGGETIWTINDATSAPVLVKNTEVEQQTLDQLDSSVYLNGKLYFLLRSQLWQSDGTAAGTTLVTSLGLANGIARMQNSAIAGDGFALTVQDMYGKSSFWLSDGTSAGTKKLFPAS